MTTVKAGRRLLGRWPLPAVRGKWKQLVRDPLAQTLAEVSWFGFVLSAILIAAFVNIVTGIILSEAGWPWALVTLALCLILTLVYANVHAEHLRRSIEEGQRRIERPNPTPRKGLIILFSNAETARKAVDWHAEQLKHVWIIVTPAMRGGAVDFRNSVESRDITCYQLDLGNEYDAGGCYRLVRYVFESHAPQLNLSLDDVIADITGGTKVMTAGMVLACADLKRAALEQVPAARAGTEDIGPLPPIEVAIDR